ncbi:MAG: hypothetical protein ACRC1K_24490 [Planctomycetia bacterium]
MAKKKATPVTNRPAGITSDRTGRLYKMLKMLAKSTVERDKILKRLSVGARTFYRDLDVLRECGIRVVAADDGYQLLDDFEQAIGRLPFPDPGLTYAEAAALVRGRTTAHVRLKGLFKDLTD